MKKIFYIAVSLFTFVLFQSCDKEIEFKGEVQDPMIVINGVITAGEEIALRLTESQFFLNAKDAFKTIDNAEVNLYVNDTFKEELKYKLINYNQYDSDWNQPSNYSYGAYIANYIPKAGDHIRIEAKHAVLNTAEVSIILPGSPVILLADTLERKIKEYPVISYIYDDYPNYGYGDNYEPKIDTIGVIEIEQFKLRIQFKDPTAVRNFYRLRLDMLVKREGNDDFYEQSVSLVGVKDLEGENMWSEYLYAINDPILNQDATGLGSLFDDDDNIYSSNPYLMFDDALFDGESYTLNLIVQRKLRTHYFDESINSTPAVEELIMKFRLTEMTKEYRYFLQSITAYDNYFPLFSEPVQILSNVKGGIGIVGGETTTTYSLRLE